MKSIEDVVKNIDKNVEQANKKLSRLKDVFYMLSSFVDNYRDDYYKTQEALGYKKHFKQR